MSALSRRRPQVVDRADEVVNVRTRSDYNSTPRLAASLGASVGFLIHLGAFKGTSALRGLPLDPTILMSVIVSVLGLAIVIKRRGKFESSIKPLLGLWMMFTLGLPFAGTTTYAHQKVILLFTLCAGIAFVNCIMSDNREFVKVLLWTQVVAGGLMAVLLELYGDVDDTRSRLLLDGSNSIGSARVVGAAIVVLFTLSFTSRRRLVIHSLVILGLSTILIGIGSRGPVLFAVLSALVAAGMSRWIYLNKSLRPLASTVLVGGLVYYIAIHFEGQRPLRRILLPLTESLSADQSIGARLALMKSSVSLIAQHPLGVGWGNFAPAARVDGLAVSLRHVYPHNILLEVGVEAGVATLVALLLVIIAALRGLYRCSVTASAVAVFALGVYFVGNALVSGDLSSNRPAWCVIGLGIGCWVRLTHTAPRNLLKSVDSRSPLASQISGTEVEDQATTALRRTGDISSLRTLRSNVGLRRLNKLSSAVFEQETGKP